MKISVLAENIALSSEYIAEHGLSLYIEINNKKILFDMGQTDAFAKNAETLGIDLKNVDFAVISHGHYDHGGGLKTFLDINKNAPIYLNCHAFENHFSDKYIGLDKSLQNHPQLLFVKDYLRIDENIELFSCNNVQLKYPICSFGLTAEIDGEIKNDDFRHEQYMLIKEGNKKILISGCSHKGIVNLTEHFKPDILVGGFHFMKICTEGEGRERLNTAAEELNKQSTVYYTCHCTGEAQYRYLKTMMSDICYVSCGSCIEI